ncbi:dihydrofolate reductase [Paucilactobacillus suebicus]|uniref:Dihydrofolate reductase n=1 Tax=Paucilactobacillus suebicus DSM 5007 = KCTC 3549 TaxID=1423807 RepID=A0A0R1W1E6_9LACO|nr:dihydrofolate reductase [Paucilactobacillus suebicus]KRM11543.1 dihydrofolate reductase [Paucilactobacillus suebicus DSM 5007 = KCTC 3549]
MIGFIWAEDLDGNIGSNGQLPWHLPADMARFKKLTTGHTIVMGKATYESMKRPLPKRRNIVLSSSLEERDGIEIVRNISELSKLLAGIDDDIYIIGGAGVFNSTVSMADHLFRTVIESRYNGDTKIPPIDYSNWRLIEQFDHAADEKNESGYRFETWQKLNVE